MTSSAGTADHAVLQRPHEIVGDDVLAAGDVDDPGVVLHHLQLGQRDHLLGLGSQRQGQHDEIGTRQRIDVSVGGQHLVDAFHLLDPVADDGDMAIERLEHPNEGARDSATAEDGDLASDQVATGLAEPRCRLHVRAEPAQAGERQRECQLGDRLGEDALAACPVPVVLDQMDERLDPCVGQLHPADLRSLAAKHGLELVCEAWLGPHQCLGFLDRNDLASAGADSSLQPMLATLRIGADCNSRWPVRREDSDGAGLLGGMHREASSQHEYRPQLFRRPSDRARFRHSAFPRPSRPTGRDFSAPRHPAPNGAQPPASVDAIFDDESPDLRSTEYTNPNAITVTPNSTTAAAPTNGLVVLLAVPMT